MANSAKKHIVIAKLFDFGGGNSHLKMLIKYLGAGNVVLVLANVDELAYLKKVAGQNDIKVVIMPQLHAFAHLKYRFTTNVKEFLNILYSILLVKLLSLKYKAAAIHICSCEPERYLYLLWTPMARVLYTLHSTPGEQQTPFTAYTCNHTLGARKLIITVSKANRALICKSWAVADKKKPFVKVISNCLADDRPIGSMSAPPSSNLKTVLTLGHVIDYKNPGIWLEVAQKITAGRDDVIFKWLGDGPLYNEYKAATLNSKSIVFEGYRADPIPFLKEAAIYYQPSVYETQGIAVIEAMANYLPCVVSDIGGLPESVQQGVSGFLVSPSLAGEHITALITLLNDAGLRHTYGKNGHQRYEDHFTYAIFEQQMDLVYAS